MTLDSSAIQSLESALRGQLILPESPEYDRARSVWNGMIDRRPALIARCLGVRDVVAGVNFARDQGLPLSIKGGGHNISGLAVADGAMMLDMSLMRGVVVDRDRTIAHAQAGCTLGDVDSETQLHGLAAVLGFVSNTGIAGLTLGGGFGYLSKRYGWTSDNVTEIELVTAQGEIVRASESENADLFWGVRGGGGNFGVATRFDYTLYPVGPTIMAGAVAWKGDDAEAVLEMFGEASAEAPPELSLVGVLRKAPPAPWLPPEVHGELIVAVFACHSGSLEEGEKLVAPIKAFGHPVGDILQPRPYAQQQSILDATQPNGRRYYWKSEYLPGYDPGLVERAIASARSITSPHSAILLFPLGGAIADRPDDHSAVGNRDASAVINIAASWDDAAEDERHIGWARDTWSSIRPFSTGGTYVNFLTEEEGDPRIRDAYGTSYDRLAELKAKWDPDNFFRLNKNIEPGGG